MAPPKRNSLMKGTSEGGNSNSGGGGGGGNEPVVVSEGVTLRPWGRYSAVIKNPFTKKMKWLGYFDTAEEASTAYDKAKVGFSNSGAPRKKNTFKYASSESEIASGSNIVKEKNLENMSEEKKKVPLPFDLNFPPPV